MLINRNIEDMSTDELRLLAKKYLDDQRYGLHWDRSSVEEEFIEMLGKGALPTLKEVKSKSFDTDVENGGDHLLIEGDNYHALSLLQFTHKEQVDVIYIDPPYNTGNKDFRYNDNFINKEDQYRHSKWLNFMDKRLELARNLLKDDGVIFVSIDESELSQLKLLMDSKMGESNYVTTIIWDSMGTRNDSKTFNNVIEYILIYSKDRKALEDKLKIGFRIPFEGYDEVKKIEEEFRKVKDDYEFPHEELESRLKSFYKDNKELKGIKNYRNVEKDTLRVFYKSTLVTSGKGGGYRYDILHPITNKPCKSLKSPWSRPLDSLNKMISKGKVWFGEDEKDTPTEKKYLDESKGIIASNIISMNGRGNKEIERILGTAEFSYPKPVDLIKKLIRLYPMKNALILDFFAGSGTTGQAVLELNKEDGGNRKFILCTNNEINGDSKEREVKNSQTRVNEIVKEIYEVVGIDETKYGLLLKEKEELESKYGVCSTVTYPRLNAVMSREDYNLGGNLKYLKCDFIPFKEDIIDMSYDYMMNGNIIDIVKVRENVFKEVLKTDGFEVYENNDKIVAIQSNNEYGYNSPEVSKVLELSSKSDKKMYVFSESNDLSDVVVFYNEEGVQLAVVPRNLLDILYNQYNFKKEVGE